MPGPVSESAPEPPICKCGHYKSVHHHGKKGITTCDVVGCDCQKFQKVDLDETPLGESLNDWIESDFDKDNLGKLLSQWVKAQGGAERAAKDMTRDIFGDDE
jgi:hypothetical protein